MNETLKLYGYWRSSAAYRVRIGLNLKGLPYEQVPVHLVRDGGEQHAPDYAATNPQKLVPVLVHGERKIRQSMAILEYLEELWPEPPLLPVTPRDRARTRALAQLVACDIHPLNNLRVLQYLEREWNAPQSERDAGCGTGSSRASPRSRRCWSRIWGAASSAKATRRASPTAA